MNPNPNSDPAFIQSRFSNNRPQQRQSSQSHQLLQLPQTPPQFPTIIPVTNAQEIQISQFISQPNIEVEAKFGFFRSNPNPHNPNKPRINFISSVHYTNYSRLKDSLQSDHWNHIITHSTVETDTNKIRKITDHTTNQSFFQTKNPIYHFDFHKYNIRTSISSEINIPPPQVFVPNHERTRIRHTYTNPTYPNINIDISEITTQESCNSPNAVFDNKYEVEVEFHGSPNLFNNIIKYVWTRLFGSNLMYPVSEKNNLNYHISRFLNPADNTISKNSFPNARNLKRSNLTYKTLVNNYSLTHKADGTRKILISYNNSIWLVYPPYDFNKLFKLNINLPTFVIDGEQIDDKLYIGFDILISNSEDTRNIPFSQRFEILKQAIDVIQQPIDADIFNLQTKPTFLIKSVQDYFDHLITLFTTETKFPQDGIIFQPQYNSDQIFKWKLPKDMTIDLAIRHTCDQFGGTIIQMTAYDPEKKENVEFTGTRDFPLFEVITTGLQDEPTNLVVEMEPFEREFRVENTDITFTKVVGLQPRKIRRNKTGANSLPVAMENWTDANMPITIDDLIGNNMFYPVNYHKLIKSRMFSEWVKPGTNLLDIGSGRGGDVNRWRSSKLASVVAVEPDSDNRAELNRRVDPLLDIMSVRILPIGGEESEIITDQLQKIGVKYDVISLMLSLSFFWESAERLDGLVETIINNISDDGIIIFFTIDGDRVESMFYGIEEIFNGYPRKDMMLGNVRMVLYGREVTDVGGQKFYFDLPGSIAESQMEYLVRMRDLDIRLGGFGYVREEINLVGEEKLMTRDQRVYNSLYRYGRYRKRR